VKAAALSLESRGALGKEIKSLFRAIPARFAGRNRTLAPLRNSYVPFVKSPSSRRHSWTPTAARTNIASVRTSERAIIPVGPM
jgi:hypothetical protein